MQQFHVLVLQKMSLTCSQVRVARAARLFFFTRPMKFLIRDVVILVSVVDANTRYYVRSPLSFTERPRFRLTCVCDETIFYSKTC